MFSYPAQHLNLDVFVGTSLHLARGWKLDRHPQGSSASRIFWPTLLGVFQPLWQLDRQAGHVEQSGIAPSPVGILADMQNLCNQSQRHRQRPS